MSACTDRELALSAYLDAELEPAAADDLERHLAACPDCRADLAALQAVSDAVRGAGPLGLRDATPAGEPATATAGNAARASGSAATGNAPLAGSSASPGLAPLAGSSASPGLASPAGSPASPVPAAVPGALPDDVARVVPLTRWKRSTASEPLRALAAAAVVVLAVAVGYGTGRRRGEVAARDAVTTEVLSAHLRALLPGRLVDVASSDRHQVKPWFAGRLDFSPPVPDLAAQGFPLLGGRLDFVSGQRAAVLVYGRRLHRIDVFVVPAVASPRTAAARLGYNFLTWREGPLTFIAVSDVAPADLKLLASLHAAAAR